MSPVWIPWILFWGVTVLVILRMFQSSARRERMMEFLKNFETWESSALAAFSRQVETWEDEGVSTQYDSDMKKAALMTLKRRKEKNFEG